MEILLLFILNIFTGALIYLLLSLKIERNSSTFQEQKLRKEMGEIITEFNATAERNITLLEARISVLKRLMGETGPIKSMDVTLEHKPDSEKIVNDKKPVQGKTAKTVSREHGISGDRIITKNAADIAEISFSGRLEDSGAVKGSSNEAKRESGISVISNVVKNSYIQAGVFTEDQAAIDEKAVSRGSRLDYISDESLDINQDKSELVQYEDPAELFQAAENKYALIAELHGRGYTVEDLAAYSGLPAGEVKLVISLNK